MILVGSFMLVQPAMAAHKKHHQIKQHRVTRAINKNNQIGLASWYGNGFSNRKTASGERFHSYGLTAAHRSLPLGTMVIVKNLSNGKTTTLKINDRGPYVGHRIMDVSKGAAIKLGMIKQGTARIAVQVIGDKLPVEYAEAKD